MTQYKITVRDAGNTYTARIAKENGKRYHNATASCTQGAKQAAEMVAEKVRSALHPNAVMRITKDTAEPKDGKYHFIAEAIEQEAAA